LFIAAASGCGDDDQPAGDTDGESSASGDGPTTGTPPTPPTATDGAPTPTTGADSTGEPPDTTSGDSTGDDTGSTGGEKGYGGNILIPELLEGNDFDLVIDEGTHTFTADGRPSDTAGYNGGLLGPTMVWTQGEDITISLTNEMADDTTTHWHGAHVSPENDGGPHQMITSGGGVWNPGFEVLNAAATMWYHPHLHEETANQVRRGLAGFIIVRDAIESALDLPREYGIDDLPLVLQDKQLDDNGVLLTAPDRGNTMTVNGTADAYKEVPAQLVRLRLLNGSLEYAYQLEFSDGRPFQIIANDLGLLEAPVQLTSLRLAPGERFEVVVDFGDDEGDSVTLRSLNSELGMGIIGGPTPMAVGLEGTDFDVIRFDVEGPTGTPTTELPAQLTTHAIPSEVGAVPHPMVMTQSVDGFLLNGASMNMQVINEYVEGETTEIWSIENQTAVAHPFHIHDVHFFVLDRDPVGPAPAVEAEDYEAGPKDTILVLPGETVRFIADFDDFTFDPADGIAQAAYMYHCHILPHEDDGMMGQFAVCPPGNQICEP